MLARTPNTMFSADVVIINILTLFTYFKKKDADVSLPETMLAVGFWWKVLFWLSEKNFKVINGL